MGGGGTPCTLHLDPPLTRFLRKNFPYEKKEAQLAERKFKKTTTNIKRQTCLMEKKKTENHIEVSISHL